MGALPRYRMNKKAKEIVKRYDEVVASLTPEQKLDIQGFALQNKLTSSNLKSILFNAERWDSSKYVFRSRGQASYGGDHIQFGLFISYLQFQKSMSQEDILQTTTFSPKSFNYLMAGKKKSL